MRTAAALVLAFTFFISLLWLWGTGAATGYIVGGLVPWSDALGYFRDALRVRHGLGLSPDSPGRPLYPSFLAALLVLTGERLQIALMIQAAAVGLACLVFAQEVARSYGTAAALAALGVLWVFVLRFAGMTVQRHEKVALPHFDTAGEFLSAARLPQRSTHIPAAQGGVDVPAPDRSWPRARGNGPPRSPTPFGGYSRNLFVSNAFGTSWGNSPAATAVAWGAPVYTDSLGFRVSGHGMPPDVPWDQPAVLILGASAAFGPGVAEELTFVKLIRQSLSEITV